MHLSVLEVTASFFIQMGTCSLIRSLFHSKITLFFIVIAVLVVSQCIIVFPFWTTFPTTTKSDMDGLTRISPVTKASYASSSNAFEKEADVDDELRKGFNVEKREMLHKSFTPKGAKDAQGLLEKTRPIDNMSDIFHAHEAIMQDISKEVHLEGKKIMNESWSSSDILFTTKGSSSGGGMQSMVEVEHMNEKTKVLKCSLPIVRNKSMIGIVSKRNKLVEPTSIMQMNSLLLQSYNSSSSMV